MLNTPPCCVPVQAFKGHSRT